MVHSFCLHNLGLTSLFLVLVLQRGLLPWFLAVHTLHNLLHPALGWLCTHLASRCLEANVRGTGTQTGQRQEDSINIQGWLSGAVSSQPLNIVYQSGSSDRADNIVSNEVVYFIHLLPWSPQFHINP